MLCGLSRRWIPQLTLGWSGNSYLQYWWGRLGSSCCLVCSMWSSGRYKDFIKLTGLFSLDCLLLEASIAPYLSATQLESQRLWSSCKSTPKPTKQAIPAWLVAPEICLKLCLKTLQCWSRRAAEHMLPLASQSKKWKHIWVLIANKVLETKI